METALLRRDLVLLFLPSSSFFLLSGDGVPVLELERVEGPEVPGKDGMISEALR